MMLRKAMTGNQLLDLLPPEESRFVRASAHSVFLSHSDEIYSQDGPIPYVYFPKTVVFGLVVLTEDGKLIETGSIGNEGVAGLPSFLGVDTHPSQVVAQIPGEALRLSVAAFRQAARPGTTLEMLLKRYTLYRLRTAEQTGVCNTMHSVEERMCRMLLKLQDRTDQDEFFLTHEFLSELLGLRRQTVSITAAALQSAGLVTYRRGLMRIVNREGLEQASCECYQYIKDLFPRMLGHEPRHAEARLKFAHAE